MKKFVSHLKKYQIYQCSIYKVDLINKEHLLYRYLISVRHDLSLILSLESTISEAGYTVCPKITINVILWKFIPFRNRRVRYILLIICKCFWMQGWNLSVCLPIRVLQTRLIIYSWLVWGQSSLPCKTTLQVEWIPLSRSESSIDWNVHPGALPISLLLKQKVQSSEKIIIWQHFLVPRWLSEHPRTCLGHRYNWNDQPSKQRHRSNYSYILSEG